MKRSLDSLGGTEKMRTVHRGPKSRFAEKQITSGGSIETNLELAFGSIAIAGGSELAASGETEAQ